MDSASIEIKALQPLQEDLDKINKITNSNDIIDLAAEFHKKGIDVFIPTIMWRRMIRIVM
jgi:predicted metalloendopeptidase